MYELYKQSFTNTKKQIKSKDTQWTFNFESWLMCSLKAANDIAEEVQSGCRKHSDPLNTADQRKAASFLSMSVTLTSPCFHPLFFYPHA